MRKWNLYRADPNPLPWSSWILKRIETVIKLLPILLISLVPAAFTCTVWYFGFYRTSLHFLSEVSEAVIVCWITFVGFLYSILTGVIVTSVVGEYKAIRMAIKRHDLETFMSLRDEDVSPMIHAFMTVLALFGIVTFMGFEYPNMETGIGAVGAVTYVFAFIYWIIREIDDPFYGFWFIKNIPPGWLECDPKVWREKYYAKIIKETAEGIETTETTVVEEVTSPAASETDDE